MAKDDQKDLIRRSRKVPSTPRPASPTTAMVLRSRALGESSGSERSDSRMTTRSNEEIWSHSATDTHVAVDQVLSSHQQLSYAGLQHQQQRRSETYSEVILESGGHAEINEIVLSAQPKIEATVTRARSQTTLSSASSKHVTTHRGLFYEPEIKTDYTYSRSYYVVPPTPVEPTNMSRFPLRSAEQTSRLGNGLSDTAHTQFASNGGRTTVSYSEQNVLCAGDNNLRRLRDTNHNGSYLATEEEAVCTRQTLYGLDSDSEDEVQSRTATKGWTKLERRLSWFDSRTVFLGRAFGAVWRKLSDACFVLMQYIYWFVAYTLLLETWMLMRPGPGDRTRQARRTWWPIVLPLLLLLCGCGMYRNGIYTSVTDSLLAVPVAESFSDETFTGASTTSSFDFSGSVIGFLSLPGGFLRSAGAALSYFFVFGRQLSEEKEPAASESSHHQRDDIKVSGQIVSSDDGLNWSQIRDFIRNTIREEVDTLSSRLAAERQHHASEQRANLDLRLSSVRDAVSLNTGSVLELKDDVAFLKAELQKQREASQEDATGARFQRMDELLLKLEERLNHLEVEQVTMLGSLRNCCRNHSEYGMFVEEHVISVLNKLSDDNSDQSPLLGFRRWLQSLQDSASSQVDQQDVDSWAKKISALIVDDIHSDVESIAKSAAGQAFVDLQGKFEMSSSSTTAALEGTSESVVRAIVKDALALYAADRIGKTDYALESSGGSVISTRCSETYYLKTAQLSVLGFPLWYTSNTARIVIQPSVYPGECWAFKGSAGYVVIQLSMPIRPTAFTLEHIPRSLAPRGKIDSAPKEFDVLGLSDEQDPEPKLLGRYVYDQEGEPVQHFAVMEPNPSAFPIVELRVLSNHGNPDYTCIYRFRVHGVLSN